MNQPNQTQSLLKATPYRNPRHAEEEREFEESLKATQDTREGQSQEGTAHSEQPEHNWEKRYKDLQSYTSRKINDMKRELDDVRREKAPELVVPQTEEELQAFQQKNPETFNFIEQLVAKRLSSEMSKYDQTVADLSGDLMESKIEKATIKLRSDHPDFEEIVASDKFHEWAKYQTDTIQDWIYNNPDKPELASKALSLFKFETGWGKSTDAKQDQSYTQGNGDHAVKTRSSNHNPEAVSRNHPAYTWKESEIKRMRPEEFQKWEESITLAQREGRILFNQ